MMQALYYDRDGRPVSQQEWRRLGRQPGYSRVGYADAARHGRQVTVITFWSGIAGDGPDGPLIFCTCAGIRGPGGQHPAYQRLWGWPDIAAARAGHQAVTAWIAEVADFLAGHASQLPAPGPKSAATAPDSSTSPTSPLAASCRTPARETSGSGRPPWKRWSVSAASRAGRLSSPWSKIKTPACSGMP